MRVSENGKARMAIGGKAGSSRSDAPLIEVGNLRVLFGGGRRAESAPVESVSFALGEGERVALVGESGSGKSLTALAMMGMIKLVGGRTAPESSVRYRGNEILGLPEPMLRHLRGGTISMVFQDPLSSLNPVHTVGKQISEALSLHRPDLSRRDHRDVAVDLMRQVHLRRPERLFDAYPHELSGGMRQRVVVATALAGDPEIILADEPTTALDVTVQAGVLDLLYELSETRGVGILLITHDLSIVAGFTNRVLVMYGGRIVEEAATDELYRRPRMPYTAALMGSIPPLDAKVERLVAIPGVPPEPTARPEGCAFNPRCEFAVNDRCTDERPVLQPVPESAEPHGAACVRVDEIDLTRVIGERRNIVDSGSPARDVLLDVSHLTKRFRVRAGGLLEHDEVLAVDDVSFQVSAGEVFGIVGESGSGKTTLTRCLLRLMEPTSGSVRFDGVELLDQRTRQMRGHRRSMQMVFQDPASSLDPRMRVSRLLAEPLRIHGLWGQPGHDRARLAELLDIVQLPSDSLERFPHEFSGGQRQRIAIARALALGPRLLVCDEPVSALDVSVRSSILNLLADLQRDLNLTVLFIAHDLSLVRFLCDRVGVMYQGQMVELSPVEQLFASPQHAHTKELLLAQPVPDPGRERHRRQERRQASATVIGP